MIAQYLATLVATINEPQRIYGSSHPAGKFRSGDTSAVALLERLHGHRILGEPRLDPSASSARLGGGSEVHDARLWQVLDPAQLEYRGAGVLSIVEV
jgi:hypothetical protein